MSVIYLDLETTGLSPHTDKVRLIQAYRSGQAEVWDVFKTPEAMDDLLRIVEDPRIMKVFHNAKFDLSFVRAHAGRRVRFANIYDTMLCEQVLLAGWSIPYHDKKSGEVKRRMPEFSLAALVMKHIGEKLDKSLQASDWGSDELTKSQLEYAMRDVTVLPDIVKIQIKLLRANKLEKVAMLEFATLSPIIEMEWHGMGFNWSKAEQLRAQKVIELAAAKKDLEAEARGKQKSKQVTLFGDDAGVDVNFRSPAQITRYLRDKLGFDVDSSDVETLKTLDHPFCAKLLKFRGIEKQIQFIDQFDEYGGRSGRLYPTYNQARAATGRMSSSKPNGQQIPKRGEGKIFRTLFEAKSGHKLVKVDFAAVEMRVMAALSKDPAMTKAIITGTDLHKLTAAKTSGKELKDVTKDERQKAKAVNFGLIYGMSAPTLKKYAWFNYGVKMTEQEAEDTRNAFFDLYRGIADWHNKQKSRMTKPVEVLLHSHDKGYYHQWLTAQFTLFGRRRVWPNYMGETMAKPTEFFNSADQGTSADITKLALIRLYEELPEYAHIVACVHDEIVVETPEGTEDIISELMLKVMREEGSKLCNPVPIDAEAEVKESWG